MRALWDSGRSFNKSKVETLMTQALESPPPVVVVTNVVTKEKKQGRPIPLNTVSLLKACSKALGIGPHSAMQVSGGLPACDCLYRSFVCFLLLLLCHVAQSTH